MLRSAGVLLIIYAALVLYINLRKQSILNAAYEEIEIKKERDTIFVTCYRLACSRPAPAALYGQPPVAALVTRSIDPIYTEKEYLRRRYGVFYP